MVVSAVVDGSDGVKVLFEVDDGEGGVFIESLWAVAEDGGYRIDDVPFFARGFAWGDVVAVERDPDGGRRCTKLVAPSGHSTIRLAIANAGDIQRVRQELRLLGCDSELGFGRVAVDVPPNVPYPRVREYLDARFAEKLLDYEEGCLGQGSAPPAPVAVPERDG